MEMPKDQLLALDIGTRSVIGVLLRPENDKYSVVDFERVEHSERAMLDGQIHDIEKVTSVVRGVVDALQERNGAISQAAIAAAGRTLVTERVKAEIELDLTKEIDKEVTDRLQMLAVQKAQSIIDETRNGRLQRVSDDQDAYVSRPISTEDYYTVGHSVIEYRLDDALILNPYGHRGSRLAVEIIATFLPHIVVDSLYTVLGKAGLDVLNLTLEPIAAMNVAIPQKLRLLNLALVDIGAGTSDIAISKDGTIHSYGMVAMAGDSITEVVAREYLLDFNAAEELKIKASVSKNLKYTDVIGLAGKTTAKELFEKVSPTLDELTSKIAESILELNGKAPSAVFCIGGGSQLRGLREKLASKLGLSADRVAVKSIEHLDMVSFKSEPPTGPEYITPIGIGVTAVEERDHDFLQVTVGGTTIRIFNTKKVQLSDALLLSGYNAKSLLSERGQSIFVTVDGIEKEIKGEFGEPACLMVNGQVSSLDRPINHKDQVIVVPAKAGERRRMRLGELVKTDEVCYLRGMPFRLVDYISVGGINRTPDFILKDGDEIVTKGIKTVEELAHRAELDFEAYCITLGGEALLGAEPLIRNAKYEIGSREEYEAAQRPDGAVRFGAHAGVNSGAGADAGAGQLFQTMDSVRVAAERRPVSTVHNGMEVTVNGTPYIVESGTVFVQLFDIIGFDTSTIGFDPSQRSKNLEMLLNGEPANFRTPLKNGDMAVIRWI